MRGSAKAVIVTRPEPGATRLCNALKDRGVPVVRFPTLGVRSRNLPPIRNLDSFTLCIFVSPNAVRSAPPWLLAGVASLPLFAVGASTAAAIAESGMSATAPVDTSNSEALLGLKELSLLSSGDGALIVRGGGGREKLASALRARGVQVTYADVYERYRPAVDDVAREALRTVEAGCRLLVTSREGLRNLAHMIEAPLLCRLRSEAHVVTLSERLSAVVRTEGYTGPVQIVPPHHGGLVAALCCAESAAPDAT